MGEDGIARLAFWPNWEPRAASTRVSLLAPPTSPPRLPLTRQLGTSNILAQLQVAPNGQLSPFQSGAPLHLPPTQISTVSSGYVSAGSSSSSLGSTDSGGSDGIGHTRLASQNKQHHHQRNLKYCHYAISPAASPVSNYASFPDYSPPRTTSGTLAYVASHFLHHPLAPLGPVVIPYIAPANCVSSGPLHSNMGHPTISSNGETTSQHSHGSTGSNHSSSQNSRQGSTRGSESSLIGPSNGQPPQPVMAADLTEEEAALLQDIRRRKATLLLEIQSLKDEIHTITNEMSRLEASGGGLEAGGALTANSNTNKQIQRNKQLSIGRKRFNLDPKKGIEYLQQHGLLGTNTIDVANFLFKGEGLNKTAIGDYLGEKSDFNESVLAEFVALHDFTNLILVQALRQFLWSFRLPGEAQKIDRMMECFAKRYCAQNAGMFSHSDVCYVLSFSVIMLNTSLHNPAVRDKPSLDTFISMNRGINGGADLPRDLLASLYDSIKHEPFKIPEDDGNDLMDTFFNPDREGWLWKQGGGGRGMMGVGWKRRWFILKDKCLYYFEYTTDKEPRGIIPLENVRVRDVPDSKSSKHHSFELVSALGPNEVIKACKTDTDGKVIEGRHTVYRMSAASPDEKTDWIQCIKRSISHSPFYDMLAARKKKIQDN